MSARKRRLTYEQDGPGFTSPDFETSRSKRDVTAPEIDICSLPIEISPAFDPDRALLRRVFFLDRNRYVSVAFYPVLGYAALMEFGGHRVTPIRLTDQQVTALAEHLPRLCANIHYTSGTHDGFKINTTGIFRIARMNLSLGKHKHIAFELQDLRYLNIMYIIMNQLDTITLNRTS